MTDAELKDALFELVVNTETFDPYVGIADSAALDTVEKIMELIKQERPS